MDLIIRGLTMKISLWPIVLSHRVHRVHAILLPLINLCSCNSTVKTEITSNYFESKGIKTSAVIRDLD